METIVATTKIKLDDLYHMLAYIYSDKNSERSISTTFAHFIEVCGMLTMHAKQKRRDEVSLEDALCKVLGWYFPLLAKLKVASVEELLFRKYPKVCPYCRLEVHDEARCKQVKGTNATVNHKELRDLYDKNKDNMPISLNDWQLMFAKIYKRDLKNKDWGVISLFEELGELAEAIRVVDIHPKYLAGEAADVFSHIMGIATEHNYQLQSEGKPEFNFETEFLKRYPGLCPQCGYQICICPSVPDSTIGRMAKELDLNPLDKLFSYNQLESEKRAITICNNVLQTSGGFVEVASNFRYDRGDTNRAMVLLCIFLADAIESNKPEVAERLRKGAMSIAKNPKRPGEKANGNPAEDVVTLIRGIWTEINLSIFESDKSITGILARKLMMQNCKIGIVTALPKEFAAMREMFEDCTNIPVENDPNEYVIGSIPALDGSGNHLVALTSLTVMGNNSASSAAAHLLRSFTNIEDVIMVGIAGGIPNQNDAKKHVRLGDIVITNEEGVIQYDNLKKGVDKIEMRGIPTKPSARLVTKVKMLETERIRKNYPWEKYICRGEKLENSNRPDESTDKFMIMENSKTKEGLHPVDTTRRDHLPKIHLGKIGAANILLKDPELRDQLHRDLGVIAVEMEGSGIADATWDAGQQYIIIRGICDYCDPNKEDTWQGYAAIVASTYTRALIESISAKS